MSIQTMPCVAIVGPTASGKSAFAIRLAKKINGEIISADSRQVYRGMDIGSGKITKKEQREIRHYCLDVASPKATYTVTDFVLEAKRSAETILQKNKVPIVCGGTGFWIDALVEGRQFPYVPPNPLLRKKLSKKSSAQLYATLQRKDPKRAAHIDRHNPVRLIRALEIIKAIGAVPQTQPKPMFSTLWLGLRPNKQKLKKAIQERLRRRLRQGMVREIKRLHEQGVPWKRMYDMGLEYRYGSLYVRNQITRSELESQLASAIWKFAKRQQTWFKRNKKIHWITSLAQAKHLFDSFIHHRTVPDSTKQGF